MGAIEQNVPSFGGDAHNLVDGRRRRYDGDAVGDSSGGIPVHERATRRNCHHVGAPDVSGPEAQRRTGRAEWSAPAEATAPRPRAPPTQLKGRDEASVVAEIETDIAARGNRSCSGSNAYIDGKTVGVNDTDREKNFFGGGWADKDVATNGSGRRYEAYQGLVG